MTKTKLLTYSRQSLLVLVASLGHKGIGNKTKSELVDLYLTSLSIPDEKAFLVERFYDLWDASDPQIVKQANEICDGSESFSEKQRKLQALVVFMNSSSG